jgi:hypothetical protein
VTVQVGPQPLITPLPLATRYADACLVGIIHPIDRAKYDAWRKRSGMPKSEAQAKLISLVKQVRVLLIP